MLTSSLVLDPRISYSGLLADCGDDLDAHTYLETTKERLHAHFHGKYDKPLLAPAAPVASTFAMNSSSQKVDFTSRYRNLPQAFMDEVQEYFKLPHENFDTCDSLVGIHSSLTSLVLHGIFFQFPVSSQLNSYLVA